MFSNCPDDSKDAPEATNPPGAGLSNLRRFAAPQAGFQDESTTICGDVLEAAHRETVRLGDASRVVSPEARRRVEAMLGVISYCYAKGLFDSEEIERRLWNDEAFLATFEDDIPCARRIRQFRRCHRENILAIIEQALQQYERRTSSQRCRPCGHEAAEPGYESARLKAQHLLDMANIMDQLTSD